MFTAYSIYSKFDKFLEDDPPPQRPIVDRLKSFKDSVERHFDKKPEPQQAESTSTQKPKPQQQQAIVASKPPVAAPRENRHQPIFSTPVSSTNEKRSTSLFGKIERSWETKGLPSTQPPPASWQRMGPRVQSITKPAINLSSDEDEKVEKEEEFRSIDRSLFIEETTPTIEPIYYQENAEVQIAIDLLKKFPKGQNLDRLANTLERMQKKEKFLQQQISERAGANQHLMEKGFVQVDSIVFRVNSCFARTQRARESLQFLQKNHTQLGIRIQRKLTVQKQKEQQVQFLIKFRDRYLLIIKILQQMDDPNKKHFPVAQFTGIVQKVLFGLSDPQEAQFMKNFRCFTNLKQIIEQKHRRWITATQIN